VIIKPITKNRKLESLKINELPEARQLVNSKAGFEPPGVWLQDKFLTTIVCCLFTQVGL
jgi:hypothetical protein